MTTRRGTILVVEDEEYVRSSLVTLLGRRGWTVAAAACAEAAFEERAWEGVDLVLTDLKLPGASGLDIVRRLAEEAPTTPVVVLTAFATVSSAVECMRAGAADYLCKPVDPQELGMVVERAIEQRRLRREVVYLRRHEPGGAGEPVGTSEAWREALELVALAAPADTPVLLVGESGSGKEVAARLLHRQSRRADRAFVSVNCAAVPIELFESEFFGHRRGAFTGALADREGRFQVAHGGTLFLDEIDSLPAVAQAKILRVLQDGTFERVGESRPTTVDVRLVCASNADLETAVEEGRLRADLYYRINVMTVRIPPLRERPEDIAALAEAFLAEIAPRVGKRIDGLDPRTLDILEGYPWPGNVRELRNVVERGVLLERSRLLTPASLPFAATAAGNGHAAAGGASGEGAHLHLRSQLTAAERRIIEQALEQAGGVRRHAARLLGIDERNMGYFLRKHGIR